ncbi:MAG: efflux RND transporter periplasmic adaptor subunit [Oleispira sp.]|nr:efflux RND transporter periplasmic adaptor subunit [Oleispira sp.]MBL4880511.1 efflux RND transporter periplasmic adaptor subunit [Oleispira sp.]
MNNSMNMRQALMLLGLLLTGCAIAFIIYITAPKPQRNTETKPARLVETISLKRSSERPQWTGGGEISAAQRVQLSAQVAGRIEKVAAAAIPGAELEQGQLLASIEKMDFQLQVQQQQAAVIQAQATLDLEKGQALLAKEEYQLAVLQMKARRGSINPLSLKETTVADAETAIDSSLVLREPQIAAAEAGLKTAQANLALMELYLQRTQIKMPFKGQIISRSANTGSQVSTSNMLFDVVATDEFWLQVKVSQQFLPLLDISQPVIIKQGKYRRQAEILHSLIEVDARDRQAKVLISIKNPLDYKLNTTNGNELGRLLLGSYVDCILFAKPLNDVYVIENRYIKEGGYVWVVKDNKLYKRDLNIAYQGRDKSWVESGFMAGDLLLTSNLGVVTEGTPVRLASNSKAK